MSFYIGIAFDFGGHPNSRFSFDYVFINQLGKKLQLFLCPV